MKKFLSLGLVIIFIVTALSGCALFTPKSSQISRSLVDLVMEPLNMIDPAQKEYSNDMMGDIQKLMEERSSKMSLDISVKDYAGLDELGLGDYLQSATANIDSAYDTKTGDGSIEFSALGQVGGSMAIHEGAIALDLQQILGSLIVYNFESALNFNKAINFTDRMEDLTKAISPESGNTSETIVDLKNLLYKYAEVAAKEIDASSVKSNKTDLSIMGKDTKVEMQSISLDEKDLKKITQAVLEAAVDDQELVDFILKNYPNYDDYYSDDDLKTQIQESIQYALDDIDYTFEDVNIDLDIDLYYSYSGFLSSVIPGLPFQKKTPVAIQVDFSDEYSAMTLFYKFIEDGRAFDFALAANNEYTSFSVNLSNVRDGKQYIMDGNVKLPDDTMDVKVSGTTTLENSKEIGEYKITLSSDSEYGGFDAMNLTIDSELTQVKKGASYEIVSTIGFDTNMEGTPISFELGLEGTYEFSNSVEVDLPDFDDPNAMVYDNLDELISELNLGSLYQGIY